MSNWDKFKSEFEEAFSYFIGCDIITDSDAEKIVWEETGDIFNSLRGKFSGLQIMGPVCIENHDVIFTVSAIDVHALPTLYDIRWASTYEDEYSCPEYIVNNSFKTVVSTPLQAAAAILLESHENSSDNK
jgi:hypothetical protein